MKIRSRKIWAVMLAAALTFTLGTPCAFAEQSGQSVTFEDGRWTASDSTVGNTVHGDEDENGDGDLVCVAHVEHSSGDNYTINTTLRGGSSSVPFIFWGKSEDKSKKLTDADRITLDVKCDDTEKNEPVCVSIPTGCFNDETEALRDRVVSVTNHEGTLCIKYRRDLDDDDDPDDNPDKPAWVYEFYNMDARKKVSTGGWIVADKNVTGSEFSYVDGEDYDDAANWCWANVTSPASQNKIDTVVSGTTDSRHLELGFWDNENEMRKLTTDDHVVLDVKNPENGNRDVVSVLILKNNFQDNATEADVRKIVEIKENPGVILDIDESTVEGDDGKDLPCWWFDFDGTTAQDKREALVTEERSKDTSEKTERTQVLGDDVKVTGEKKGKKWNFSVTGLKEMKGIRKLTLNAGTKFKAEDLKGLDMSKVTVSFNEADGKTTDGTAKDVKKLLKIDKRGQVTVKADKGHASYTLMIPVENCTLCLKVVSVDFDKKAVKDNKITALQGEGSTVSVNLVQFIGKNASEDESEFLSADWTVDGKTEVKTTDPTKPVKSKKGINVYLSKDYRTITLANPGDVKSGNVKIIAMINGKKYSAVVKVKVK